ncbi:MAG TPA: hypothetical protein VHD55_02960 [Candidatus Paceibacterota bacterium]|nr:hypothetical protein [Candidatus Paceibacterota bacterium]
MRIALPAAKPCIECGGDAIHHRIQYFTLLIGLAATPFSALMGRITDGASRLLPKRDSKGLVAEGLARLGLAELLEEPDDKTLLLDLVLWEEAKKRGIRMREFRLLGLPTASFLATFPGGRRIGFESIPFPARMEQPVWWIDNKTVMKKKFRALGLPVARGESAFSLAKANRIFKEINGTVIAKPAEGSASRHTTLHISDETALERGFKIAKEVSPLVVIEEELEGSVYRPTLVDGKLVATIRRDPPRVVGDGEHTIEELIAQANTHPKRQGPYFSHIKLTALGEQELKLQGLTLQSIPEQGRAVYLHPKINWALGGTTTDVTEKVHPDNKALFEEIARVLHAPIVGIDFITSDISRSWKETPKCGVIETNGRPFFDNHHLPFEGEPHNVAAVIWDLYQALPNKKFDMI